MYWHTANPYVDMDGPEDTYCVYDRFLSSTSGSVVTYKHDYDRADCAEKHRFFCQHETGTSWAKFIMFELVKP